MLEVEVKVPGDHDAVRERLDAMAAEPMGVVTQTDTYYDAPHRDFAETDEALRVRRERVEGEAESEVRVTYKGPLLEAASKSRIEHETGVGDGAVMDEILRGLGFTPAAEVEKRRTRYEVDGYTVTLDEVTDLGSFVEVEREGTKEELEAVRAGAYDVLSALGLDPDDQIRTSYLGLLLAADNAPE